MYDCPQCLLDAYPRLKWLDTAKPYDWKVFTDINMVDINYKKLDASAWRQQEYGLYGPVELTSGASVQPLK